MCVQSPAERRTRNSFIQVNPKNSGLSDHLKTMSHWSQLVFSEKEHAHILFSSGSLEAQALATLFLTLVLRENVRCMGESQV